VVDVLADELDGRLRAELLLFGHVEIINEYDALLANRRSVSSLSSFIQFSINSVLRLIGRSLRRKSKANILISLRQSRSQQFLQIQAFSRSCRARTHHEIVVG
jgi:hypothetical protein